MDRILPAASFAVSVIALGIAITVLNAISLTEKQQPNALEPSVFSAQATQRARAALPEVSSAEPVPTQWKRMQSHVIPIAPAEPTANWTVAAPTRLSLHELSIRRPQHAKVAADAASQLEYRALSYTRVPTQFVSGVEPHNARTVADNREATGVTVYSF